MSLDPLRGIPDKYKREAILKYFGLKAETCASEFDILIKELYEKDFIETAATQENA